MEQGFHIKVELVQENGSSRTENLSLPSEVVTFKKIKEKVEENYSIPECMQTLCYQGTVVPDYTTIGSLYLRNGDTVAVSYLHQGQVQEVRSVVRWLLQCTEVLVELQEAKRLTGNLTISRESREILTERNPPKLLDDLFSSWDNTITIVNAQHFRYLDGGKLLVTFHTLLVELRHDLQYHRMFNVPYLEYVCCTAIASFAMDMDTARYMAQCGGLNSCIGSLLIKAADDKSLLVYRQYIVLQEALRGIYNISEIPDDDILYQLSLRQDVIEQAILAAKTPWYSSESTTKTAISIILCLSQCAKAHVNIMKPDLIEKMITMLENHLHTKEHSDSETMALRSYVGVVFAQMICGSSHLLLNFPVSTLQKMGVVMEQACDGDSAKIQAYEESNGFRWGRFSPCVEYLYEPDVQHCCSEEPLVSIIMSLQKYATDVLVQYMINCFVRKFHVDIVVQEKLVDYIICLPWILPEGSKERSRRIVRALAKFQHIEPPSLATITKAYLAKTKWGLKKLMNMDSVSDFYVLS